MNKTILAGLVAVMLMGAGSAMAETTLEKIKATGTITLAHRESSIPFSYYDADQKVVGYSNDISFKIAEAVKAELKLAKLDIKMLPVTSSTRIPLVQNGTVDVECGSTTNNLERQKQVAFGPTIFIINVRMMTGANSGVKDWADLAGKTVVTTAGTTPERLIKQMNEEKKLGMTIVSTKDHGEAFMTLETGRAAAFVMDDVLLYGELVKAKKASDWTVTGSSLNKEAYGCMIRKDDPTFKALVDKTVAQMEMNGEMTKIYNRWFTSPVPPKNLSLNFSLSEDMKNLFMLPNDKAYQ